MMDNAMENNMENTMERHEENIREMLKEVIDPELGINIVDLGLVYDIQLDEQKVDIRMTLTTPGCPMIDTIVGGVKYVLRDFEEVNVDVVWSPPWHPGMISDEGKEMFSLF